MNELNMGPLGTWIEYTKRGQSNDISPPIGNV